jgi:diaminohydroxyphosphoribosylaminopyrimidine deaminase/5-amino-6-(5-phosphoribosylamino)uracil reductase
MQRALALARRGEALASPNPMVGAVLVREGRIERGVPGEGSPRGKIVGEGFHTYAGLRHAEIIALEAAGDAARGATLYINLEPCCHTGRTGPCTRALIDARVARVVAAMPDPNPAVAGRGLRQLRAAGIEVVSGVLAGEARRLNEAFTTWIAARRPFVMLKSALTLDGSLVLPRANNARRSHWITSPASRAEVQRMRHASDALLTGIETVLADDPLLTDRTGLPRRRRLLRVILDSRLRLSPRSQIVRTAKCDLLVFTRASASSKRSDALRRAGVEIVECAAAGKRRSGVDLRAVLAELARRDILSVLLEAGPTLNQAALAAGLVDKVRLFYAPILAGSAPAGNSDFAAAAPSRLQTLSDLRIERFGPDFTVEGYLHVHRNR